MRSFCEETGRRYYGTCTHLDHGKADLHHFERRVAGRNERASVERRGRDNEQGGVVASIN